MFPARLNNGDQGGPTDGGPNGNGPNDGNLTSRSLNQDNASLAHANPGNSHANTTQNSTDQDNISLDSSNTGNPTPGAPSQPTSNRNNNLNPNPGTRDTQRIVMPSTIHDNRPQNRRALRLRLSSGKRHRSHESVDLGNRGTAMDDASSSGGGPQCPSIAQEPKEKSEEARRTESEPTQITRADDTASISTMSTNFDTEESFSNAPSSSQPTSLQLDQQSTSRLDSPNRKGSSNEPEFRPDGNEDRIEDHLERSGSKPPSLSNAKTNRTQQDDDTDENFKDSLITFCHDMKQLPERCRSPPCTQNYPKDDTDRNFDVSSLNIEKGPPTRSSTRDDLAPGSDAQFNSGNSSSGTATPEASSDASNNIVSPPCDMGNTQSSALVQNWDPILPEKEPAVVSSTCQSPVDKMRVDGPAGYASVDTISQPTTTTKTRIPAKPAVNIDAASKEVPDPLLSTSPDYFEMPGSFQENEPTLASDKRNKGAQRVTNLLAETWRHQNRPPGHGLPPLTSGVPSREFSAFSTSLEHYSSGDPYYDRWLFIKPKPARPEGSQRSTNPNRSWLNFFKDFGARSQETNGSKLGEKSSNGTVAPDKSGVHCNGTHGSDATHENGPHNDASSSADSNLGSVLFGSSPLEFSSKVGNAPTVDAFGEHQSLNPAFNTNPQDKSNVELSTYKLPGSWPDDILDTGANISQNQWSPVKTPQLAWSDKHSRQNEAYLRRFGQPLNLEGSLPGYKNYNYSSGMGHDGLVDEFFKRQRQRKEGAMGFKKEHVPLATAQELTVDEDNDVVSVKSPKPCYPAFRKTVGKPIAEFDAQADGCLNK